MATPQQPPTQSPTTTPPPPSASSAPAPVLFQLGRPTITVRAAAALIACKVQAETLLMRHHTGDWGDVDEDDRQSNLLALLRGGRLISAYRLHDGQDVWVITEADRSQTTLLMPEDY